MSSGLLRTSIVTSESPEVTAGANISAATSAAEAALDASEADADAASAAASASAAAASAAAAQGAVIAQAPLSIKSFGAVGNGVTDDSAAFIAFNVYARALSGGVSLYIPPGTYVITDTHPPTFYGGGSDLVSNGQWLYGISKVCVEAYGATVGGLFLGGAGPYQDNLHYGPTSSISRGATSITLSNSGDAAKFAINTWALLGQIDLQGTGSFPQNLFVFEYVYITNISGTTVTVRDAIQHRYLSTWPNYGAGGSSTQYPGGPVALFAMHAAWDSDVEIRGMKIPSSGSQLFGGVREVHLIDCDFSALGNVAPSNAQHYTLERCVLSNTLNEVDKLVEYLAFIECRAAGSTQMVSASVRNVSISRCRFGGLLGVGKNGDIEASSIDNLVVGCAYGMCESMSVRDSYVGALSYQFNHTSTAGYSFSGGSFTAALASPQIDAAPGQVYVFSPDDGFFNNYGNPFKVLDMTQSGGNTSLVTTLSALPANNAGSIAPHPCLRVTMENCWGCPDAMNMSQAPAGAPLFSYGKCLIVTGGAAFPAMRLWGQLVSVTVNVIRAYTGAQSTLTIDVGNLVTLPDGSTTVWDPLVNLKIAGIRQILATSSSGAQSGDSISSRGANQTWFAGSAIPAISADTSADTQAQQAIVSVEWVLDQSAICTAPMLLNGKSSALAQLPA